YRLQPESLFTSKRIEQIAGQNQLRSVFVSDCFDCLGACVVLRRDIFSGAQKRPLAAMQLPVSNLMGQGKPLPLQIRTSADRDDRATIAPYQTPITPIQLPVPDLGALVECNGIEVDIARLRNTVAP